MTVRKFAAFASSAIALTAAIAVAPMPAQAECFKIGDFIEICDTSSGGGDSNLGTPVASTTLYDVKEYNPFTGALHASNTYTNYYEAERAYNQGSQAHWAEWRYFGIGEQNHRRRFNSYSEAEAFLAGNPCPNALNICVIEHKNVVAARVDWSER